MCEKTLQRVFQPVKPKLKWLPVRAGEDKGE